MATPAKEAGEQAATEAGNQAAQNTGPVIGFITSNPVLVLIAAISFIALAIVFAIILAWWTGRTDQEEEFEKRPLEEIVKPEFKKVVENQGKKNLSTVRRDLRREGEIWKDVRFTENDNLIEHMNKLASDDNSFDADLNIADPDGDKLNELEKSGVYTQEELQDMKDNQLVPHRLLQVRPHKTLGKVLWAATDLLLKRDWFTRYLLIPEHKIVDNPGDNSINIDRNIQLRPFAGIELPLYFESFSVLHAAVTRRLYEASLEDQVNYSEKINFFDSKFSQQIQKLEAEAQAEQEKYNRNVAGDVNQS